MNFLMISTPSPLHWSLLLFVILVAIYLYKHREKSEFFKVFGLVGSSQGLVAGCLLCYKAIFDLEWCNLSQTEAWYVIVGGLAVIWGSLTAINSIVPRA